MNRYRIDIATKVGNRHHHILLRGGRRPCNGRLSRHSYLCSRRAVVGHTAQDGIGQIGNLKFAVGGNQYLRRDLFREIGTGGIGHQNRLLNRIGISTIVKNLINTGDVTTAIAICFIIRMGHTHIITTEVTIVDHQYILQANHIQSVGKLVFTGQQTVNRQRVKHARDGRTHRVAHHNRLREGHRCISAIIREGIDTLITPFAACAAIGRVAVRDLEQNVGATIRNFKIRKLQRSGSRIIAIHICIVNAEGIVKDGHHNGTGGILNHNDLRYHIGISAPVKDLVGTGQLPAAIVRRLVGIVGHRNGVHPQVAVGEVKARRIQTAHIQRIGKDVAAIIQFVYRDGSQCSADGGAGGVAHHDDLVDGNGSIVANIRECINAGNGPCTSRAAVGRVGVESHLHLIAVLHSEIRQLEHRIVIQRTVISAII